MIFQTQKNEQSCKEARLCFSTLLHPEGAHACMLVVSSVGLPLEAQNQFGLLKLSTCVMNKEHEQ